MSDPLLVDDLYAPHVLSVPQAAASRTFTDQLAAYFRERPNVWIDGRDLEFAGRYAWRSRVSDCRQRFGMQIDNRQRKDDAGFTISEYRFATK